MTPRHFPWSLRREPSLGDLLNDVHWFRALIGIGAIGLACGLLWLGIFALIIMAVG
jgi:hypothetical protein